MDFKRGVIIVVMIADGLLGLVWLRLLMVVGSGGWCSGTLGLGVGN